MIIKCVAYPDYLMHYGVSIKDGAPGVGTGNWDRSGNSGRSQSAVRQEYYKDRKLQAEGKLDPKKTQGSHHYIGAPQDWQWKEVIKASDVPPKMNVAEHIAKDENFLRRLNATYDDNRFNTNRDWGAPGTTNNCKKCTATQEIRNRGYEVFAGRSFYGGNTAATSYWFDGAVQYKENSMDNIAKRLEKTFGNNGRGELTFSYPDGGGHSVYAYVDKGEHVISDGQSNKKFSGSSWEDTLKTAKDYYGFADDKQFTSTRLDTATPNWKHLAQDSVLKTAYNNRNMNQIYSDKFDAYGLLYDTRPGNVSKDAMEMEINTDKRTPNVVGVRYQSEPWKWGDDYYRARYR